MKIFNNGILEVLLHGKPTSDPEVEKRVQNALVEAGIDLGTRSAKVQRKLNGINVEFEEHFAPELESGLNTALRDLEPLDISFDGEIEYYGDYDGVIVVDSETENGAVSMDREEHYLLNTPTDRLVEILESRGFGVMPCASVDEARRRCSETMDWLKREQAKEILDMAGRPMKSINEMVEEAANNKLEEEK